MYQLPAYDHEPRLVALDIGALDLSPERVAQLGEQGVAAEIAGATEPLVQAIALRAVRAANELAAAYADAFALAEATGGADYRTIVRTLAGSIAAFGAAGLMVPSSPMITPEVAALLMQHASTFRLGGREAPSEVPMPVP